VIAGAKGRGSVVRMMLRRLAWGGLSLAPAVLPACYHYVPVESAPSPGVGVEVELNDVGRVGMESAVGPEVGVIQGVLESRSDTDLVVRVTQTLGEYGGVTRWEGERVAIRPDYVRTMRQRRFSTTRTVVVATAAGAGLLAFALTRDLLGFGGAPSSSTPTGGGTNSNK
jgi:hypothetical protein